MKLVLNNISLKGVSNIINSDMTQERNVTYLEDGSDKIIKENVVVTSGINLQDIKGFKGIDNTRLRCNDIGTIYKLYGIEAARNILSFELETTFNAAGASDINYNHMSLLVDFMTHTGDITSIDRHGLGKLDMDPMSKASFEKTMEHFVNAAIFNESDNLDTWY